MEYEQRMAELDELEYPKPLREFIYDTFNAFSDKHPWVGTENIRPKSIVREMFEEYLTFSGYIKRYGLERVEGLLMRHINSVYKVLMHTVPERAKTDAVREIEEYLGEMLRRVDSSLLEEWERLKNPDFQAHAELDELEALGAAEVAADITRDTKGFTAAIRTRIFALLSLASRGAFADMCEALGEEVPEGNSATDSAGRRWTELSLRDAFATYVAEHGRFRLDAEGRAARHTLVEKNEEEWVVQQLLQDHEERNDWACEFRIDLAASRQAGVPVLQLLGLREI